MDVIPHVSCCCWNVIVADCVIVNVTDCFIVTDCVIVTDCIPTFQSVSCVIFICSWS